MRSRRSRSRGPRNGNRARCWRVLTLGLSHAATSHTSSPFAGSSSNVLLPFCFLRRREKRLDLRDHQPLQPTARHQISYACVGALMCVRPTLMRFRKPMRRSFLHAPTIVIITVPYAVVRHDPIPITGSQGLASLPFSRFAPLKGKLIPKSDDNKVGINDYFR